MRRPYLKIAALALGLLLVVGTASAAETYRVVRKARLLTKPSSTSGQRIKTLHPPEVVTGTDASQVGDYVQVRDETGDVGWSYLPYLEPSGSTGGGGGGTPAPTPLPNGGADLEDASAFPIPNCEPEGNPSPNGSRYEDYKALNLLKNRMHAPSASVVQQENLSAFFAPGDDQVRWHTDMAVELEGYVTNVIPGGKETCNCRAPDPQYYDTHIEIKEGPNDPGLPMIVEVTPPWRALMATINKDWTTDGLRASILNHRVRVRGWLLQDWQHNGESENTAPSGDHLWRRTSWEIHPITHMEVLPGP